MTDLLQDIFKNRKASPEKLLLFGFEEKDGSYIYSRTLENSGLKLTVRIGKQGGIMSEVVDTSIHEPYTLHLVDSASGSFVGRVKGWYQDSLIEIAEKCFEADVFQSRQAKEIISYIRKKYGDELEFLWMKHPDNAIWRRKDTRTWYGALLTVSKRKLGLEDDDMAEIVDLRIQPEELEALIDGQRYYPGYHMNKKHWFTMRLDGSVPIKEICRRIDESYRLAGKK